MCAHICVCACAYMYVCVSMCVYVLVKLRMHNCKCHQIKGHLPQQVKLLTTDIAKLITNTGSVTTLRGLITSNCFKWYQVLYSSVVRFRLLSVYEISGKANLTTTVDCTTWQCWTYHTLSFKVEFTLPDQMLMCSYMHLYACIHMFVYGCVHMRVCAYLCVCMHIVCTSMCVGMCTHMMCLCIVCAHRCMHVLYANVCMCLYTCVNVPGRDYNSKEMIRKKPIT